MSIRIWGLLGVAIAAPACDLCSITTAIDARETRPGAIVGLEERWTEFGTIRSGSQVVDDPADQYLHSSVTLLTLGWRFTERVGVQAVVPYIHRQFRRAEGLAIDQGTEAGLGDVAVVAVATPWRAFSADGGHIVTLIAGIKAPTGDDDRLAEEAAEEEVPGAPPSGYHGHDLALGSGSWDGLFGLTGFARWQRLFVALDAQYALRTTGGHDYRYGDDLIGGLGVGAFAWLTEAGTLAIEARLSGEHKAEDELDGVEADDTAVDALYLGPLLTATWRDRLTAEAGVEWPLHQHVAGVQGVPDWRGRCSVTVRF